jgi:Glucosyl transferase GtrII
MINIHEIDTHQKRDLSYFFTIALIFVYPIIHSNIYFRDDLARVADGFPRWEKIGRPLATYVYRVFSISLGGKILDIAPLTQIASIFVLTLTAFVYNEYIKREFQHGMLFVSSVLTISPFLLGNLSYKFDSLGMVLGLFFATLAFCQIFKNKNGFIKSIVLLIVALSLYQPMINFFLGLLSLEILLLDDEINLSKIIKKVSVRISQYLISLIVYQFTINEYFYRHPGRDTLIPIDSNFFDKIFINATDFFKPLLFLDNKSIMLFFAFLFIWALSIWAFDVFKKENKSQRITCLFLALLFYIVSIFGPMILLKEPIAMPRTIPSFYLFAAFPIILTFKARNGRFSYMWTIPIIVSLGISYQYGVALKNQFDYDMNTVNLIQADLLRSGTHDDYPVYIIGQNKVAPQSKTIIEHNSLIRRNARPMLGYSAEKMFQSAGVYNTQFSWDSEFYLKDPDFIESLCKTPVTTISENSLYGIYKSSNSVYVLLNNNVKQFCSSN